MRQMFTTAMAAEAGMTQIQLRLQERAGVIHRVIRGVYVYGFQPPSPLDRAMAVVIATDGIAMGALAAQLYGLDSIPLVPPFAAVDPENGTRRSHARIISVPKSDAKMHEGIACTTVARTLVDPAAVFSDEVWEQAMESAWRKGLVKPAHLVRLADAQRRIGNPRVRRVVQRHALGRQPTESLLEILMIQLLRRDRSIPVPERQVEVADAQGKVAARVDLAFPEHKLFIELDGERHKDQPTYDAKRQNRVIELTGWKVARFTWTDVTKNGSATLRDVRGLLGIVS